MKIVVLDGYTTNPGDLSYDSLEALGDLTVYDRMLDSEIISKAQDADIVIANKIHLRREHLLELPQLKCICLFATGYNNIDTQAAREMGIPVFNSVNYSTDSVAQHVFALILHSIHRIDLHDDSVKKGVWADCPDFSYQLTPIYELAGKTLGIYGFGRIGRQVGLIGKAFGMRVISLHKHPERDREPWLSFVDKKTLLQESDVLSLHAPLTDENKHFIQSDTLTMMKKEAVLVNTGRGGLIDENHLYEAMLGGEIRAAMLDVLNQEPPDRQHPLYQLDNVFITPHQAWASMEARQRVIEIVAANIVSYQEGDWSKSVSTRQSKKNPDL